MACASIPCGSNDLVVGTYNICINGYDFGSTTGGVSIVRSAEYVDVRNDQSCTRQARYLQQQDWSFSTTLQSVTLDKLKIIYGLPDSYTDENGVEQQTLSPDGNTLIISEGTNLCVFPESFPVEICGPGPGCGCRIMSFPTVVATPESLEYTITKENPVQLEVEFTILADCTQNGLIGTWTDDCTITVPCSSDAPLVGPAAPNVSEAPVNQGAIIIGSVTATPGADPNLVYTLTDPADPKAAGVTLNTDGTYQIQT